MKDCWKEEAHNTIEDQSGEVSLNGLVYLQRLDTEPALFVCTFLC